MALLVTITSLLGILLKETYSRETMAWAIQAIGQDYANLAVVALLLISLYFVIRHSVRAYLVWLGAFVYLIYAFVIYAFAVHFQFLFLAYVVTLGLSAYTLIGGLTAVDKDEVAGKMMPSKKSKWLSAFLTVVGILFIFLWLSEIIPHLFSGTIPKTLTDTGLWTNPVHVLDLAVLLPGMIIVSVMLRRKKAVGYLLAVPLAIFTITMGLGIVVMFALSALKGMPYSLPAGLLIVIIMASGSYLTIQFLKEIKE